MALGLCLALLLLGSDESRVALEGQVGAGGGYEGNLTLAPTGEPTSGSALVAGWAGFGVGWDPGETTHLSAGLRYDGAYYPDATDLSRNSAGLDLLWIQGIGEVVAVVAAMGGAWSWYSDPARSGPGIALRATLRVKPWDWLAVRAGYGYTQRWAAVDAYSTSSNRIFASVEGRIASGIYLGLGYSWQTGEQTFYASVPVPTPVAALRNGTGRATGAGPDAGSGPGSGPGTGPGGGGGSPQGSGVFESLVPYRASTTDNTVTPTFEAAIWKELYVFANYSFTWGSSVEGSYTAQFGLAGVGYRF
ncbi:MAG: hypothetical protein WB493_12030 [Anaeromyxobacteraceae bacterium]